MRILFAGTPDVAVPSLRALMQAGHEIVGVLTRPDARVGRGKKLAESAVALAATEMGIQVFKPAKVSDDGFVAKLAELAPDVCAVVAYGGLIPQRLLDAVTLGWVNLHFSLLPAWRGAAPVQSALMAGDTVSGATTFRLVKELDAGPVYRSLRVPISPTENSGELLERLSHIGADLLVQTFDDIAAGIEPVDQDTDGVSFAPKIKVSEVEIDWRRCAEELVNLIRGASPAPGAWSILEGRRFKILDASLATHAPDEAATAPSGQIVATNKHVWVGTGSGPIELKQVQDVGKKPMNAADWARGAHLSPDSCFEAEEPSSD